MAMGSSFGILNSISHVDELFNVYRIKSGLIHGMSLGDAPRV